MKAVILVGGQGTRLRPLTCNLPKAIVPILNRPFMEHLISYLKRHGITEVILAMGYMPDPIQEYLGDGEGLGVRLTYVVEGTPLGTSGAIKNVEQYLDGPFVVFNGDIITDIDLTSMMEQHKKLKPSVSIALTPVDNPTIYGVVETDSRGMVKRFVEKPSLDQVTTNMINAGIYILEHDVLDLIPKSMPSMFENYLFPKLLKMGKPVLSFASDAYWIDIGTPEKYLKTNHDLLDRGDISNDFSGNEAAIHESVIIEGPALIAENCRIHEGAIIRGPTVVGPNCTIGKEAVIERSVLWRNSTICEKAVLKNTSVCSFASIGERSRLIDNCVVGDNVSIAPDTVLGTGSRIWPDEIGN